MHNFEITYTENLRTRAVHLKSGTKIITDAPTDNNGKGESFSPTDLVATALASCMLTIMGIAAQKHKFSIDNTIATVEKIMQANPRKISEIIITLNFPKNDYSVKVKEIIKNAARNCPVALSLDKSIKQSVDFNF